MKKEWNISSPVPMDGPHNFRDLGGYPAQGGTTRKGCFFRSDGLQNLSDADRRWMLENGITCVLDLRSRKETEQKPDALSDDFIYHSICMSDKMTEEDTEEQFPNRLSDLYILILESHRSQFRQIMRILAERGGKPSVFHCAVGKDRTGMTAMMLLSLAGVPEEIILEDYEVSERNMKPIFDVQKKILREAGWRIPESLFQSPREEMERTLEYLNGKWGGVPAYLKDCGVPEEEMEALKEYLICRE